MRSAVAGTWYCIGPADAGRPRLQAKGSIRCVLRRAPGLRAGTTAGDPITGHRRSPAEARSDEPPRLRVLCCIGACRGR